MKKTFAILTALLAISVFSVRAQEDKQMFNHLAVAPTIGFDGIGAEAITPITPYLQLHAGIAMMLPSKPFRRPLTLTGIRVSSVTTFRP